MDQGKQKWKQDCLSFQCRPRRGDERWAVLHLQPNVLFWKQKSGHGWPSHFYKPRRKDDNRDWPTRHNSGLSLSWRRLLSACARHNRREANSGWSILHVSEGLIFGGLPHLEYRENHLVSFL